MTVMRWAFDFGKRQDYFFFCASPFLALLCEFWDWNSRPVCEVRPKFGASPFFRFGFGDYAKRFSVTKFSFFGGLLWGECLIGQICTKQRWMLLRVCTFGVAFVREKYLDPFMGRNSNAWFREISLLRQEYPKECFLKTKYEYTSSLMPCIPVITSLEKTLLQLQRWFLMIQKLPEALVNEFKPHIHSIP